MKKAITLNAIGMAFSSASLALNISNNNTLSSALMASLLMVNLGLLLWNLSRI